MKSVIITKQSKFNDICKKTKLVANTLKNKKGESSYIDTVVKLLLATVIVIFAINIFAMLNTYRNLDVLSKQLTEVVTYYGTTDINEEHVAHAIETYSKAAKIEDVEVTVTAEEEGRLNDGGDENRVQLGNLITVSCKLESPIIGFGIFSDFVSVPMEVSHIGLSEVYWR